jgi:hypothetical protein
MVFVQTENLPANIFLKDVAVHKKERSIQLQLDYYLENHKIYDSSHQVAGTKTK